jgi:hypothetical protein
MFAPSDATDLPLEVQVYHATDAEVDNPTEDVRDVNAEELIPLLKITVRVNRRTGKKLKKD